MDFEIRGIPLGATTPPHIPGYRVPCTLDYDKIFSRMFINPNNTSSRYKLRPRMDKRRLPNSAASNLFNLAHKTQMEVRCID